MQKYSLNSEDQTLVFLHILKTAGQTLMPILKANFAEKKVYWGNAKEVSQLPLNELDKYDLVLGHNFYGIYKQFARHPVYLTFLRDPVERTISHFYYLKRAEGHFLYNIIKKQSLSDFVTDSRTKGLIANFQVRWLISDTVLVGEISDPTEALGLAKRRLREFAFVGITEHFYESVKLLNYTFGWPEVESYESQNIGLNRPKKDEIEASTIDSINKLIPLDIELYAEGLRLFTERNREKGFEERGLPVKEAKIVGFSATEDELNLLREQNYELSVEISDLKLELSRITQLHERDSFELFNIKKSPEYQILHGVKIALKKVFLILKKLAKKFLPKKIQDYLWRLFIYNSPGTGRRNIAELQKIVSSSHDHKGIVIFPPSIRWDAELYQRPQHMAKSLAELGYLVFYNSPTYNDALIMSGFIKHSENLFITRMNTRHFGKLIPNPILILYSYSNKWRNSFSNPFIVYEQLDELDVFDSHSIRRVTRTHNDLVKNADLVVGISNKLVSQLKEKRPDSILNTNGVDYDHFSGESKNQVALVTDMVNIVSRDLPIIGYYGALARWLDFDLIRYAADELSGEAQFVFIGPRYDREFDQSGIEDIANVHVIPPVPYRDLPAYLEKFTVATIPFVVSELTNSVSPLKLFEYMAGGKPIVTTAMKECLQYEGLLIAYRPEEYVEKVREAIQLAGNANYIQMIKRLGLENSWMSKANHLADEIEKRINQEYPV